MAPKRPPLLPLVLLLAGFTVPLLLLCAVPPIARDVLIHHLAIPKLWIEHGGIFSIPWAPHSYFPMNIELLFAACLMLGNDIAPAFVHLAFGFGTGFLIFRYLSPRTGHATALLGLFFFMTIPVVMRVGTMAYVDLGATFFTTAALLSLVPYRDSGCRDNVWLVVSAVCMGLAVGSKYTALVPWAYLNIVVILYVSRANRPARVAVRAGLVYGVVVLLVASPWLVKNTLATLNPVYPLFDGFFAQFRDVSAGGGSPGQGGGPGLGARSSFFQRRELLYGEPLWVTLLMPVRMFLFGRDNSAQFFDGVLCPALVLLAPLAFLAGNRRRDLWMFTGFVLFSLLVPVFADAARIRYIMPVLPFLAIMSAMGIRNVLNAATQATQPVAVVLYILGGVSLAYMIGFSGWYLHGYFSKVDPVPYVTGEESRDSFLERHLASYSCMRYINTHSAKDARVLLMFVRGRTYYLERDFRYDPSYGMAATRSLMRALKETGSVAGYLEDQGFTHVLARLDLLDGYLGANFSEDERDRLAKALATELEPVFMENAYMVYEVPGHDEGNAARQAREGGNRNGEPR
ncbi:MAG: ArnT family glycosyltransferase [Desulfatibacillaceae bacterium]